MYAANPSRGRDTAEPCEARIWSDLQAGNQRKKTVSRPYSGREPGVQGSDGFETCESNGPAGGCSADQEDGKGGEWLIAGQEFPSLVDANGSQDTVRNHCGPLGLLLRMQVSQLFLVDSHLWRTPGGGWDSFRFLGTDCGRTKRTQEELDHLGGLRHVLEEHLVLALEEGHGGHALAANTLLQLRELIGIHRDKENGRVTLRQAPELASSLLSRLGPVSKENHVNLSGGRDERKKKKKERKKGCGSTQN